MRLPIAGDIDGHRNLLGARVAATLIVATTGFWATSAIAATPQTAYFQYGSTVGLNNALSMTRVPITNSMGVVTYYDVKVTFTVSAAGILGTQPTVAAARSVAPTTSQFNAGRYYAQPFNGSPIACGSLTYAVGAGGSTIWTWVEDTNYGYNYAPVQAVWQTVSPSPDVEARLKAAKIPIDRNQSYGLSELNSPSNIFVNNGLLSAEASNGTIALASYTNNYGDQPGSVGGTTLKLTNTTVCPITSP